MKRLKTGGRKPGTPNLHTMELKQFMRDLINDYYQSKEFATDLLSLTGEKRVQAMIQLSKVFIPPPKPDDEPRQTLPPLVVRFEHPEDYAKALPGQPIIVVHPPSDSEHE